MEVLNVSNDNIFKERLRILIKVCFIDLTVQLHLIGYMFVAPSIQEINISVH